MYKPILYLIFFVSLSEWKIHANNFTSNFSFNFTGIPLTINYSFNSINNQNTTSFITNSKIETTTIVNIPTLLQSSTTYNNSSYVNKNTTTNLSIFTTSTPFSSTTKECTNQNDETCDFYFNVGATCDTNSLINKQPFIEYCCSYCKNIAGNKTAVNPLLTCKNINNQTCQNYFSKGVKCNSITFINQIPISIYCCETCFDSLFGTSNNGGQADVPVSLPATCSKNQNDNVCIFNYQLGARCDKLSYIENNTFQEYCCASCKNLSNATSFQNVNLNQCINYNNDTCNSYIKSGVKCNSISYIENIPFFTYCCQSCKNPSTENLTTTAATTTTTTTTTTTGKPSTINSGTTNELNTTCINVNEDTCKFYINSGAKCDSIAFVDDMLFKEYCCLFCKNQLTTTMRPSTISDSSNSTRCINYNTDTCNFYFDNGVKCDSLSYINNVPIQIYCCSSCADLKNQTLSVTTRTTTLFKTFNSTNSIPKTTTAQVCRNIDENTCRFYFNLGASCSAISFIDNIPFKQYCCASCNNLPSAATTIQKTDEILTTTISMQTSSSTQTTTKTCINVNDETCHYYFNLGAKCNLVSFINMLPFSEYCCKSCQEASNSSQNQPTPSNLTCMNYNEETCNFYFGLGAKCNSVSFINNIPFSIYCCKSCNESLDSKNFTTTTKLSTTPIKSTSTSTTTTTPVCIDIDESKCQYYFKLGADCKTISFIGNISLQSYCCKSCKDQSSSSSTTGPTKTTNDFNICQDLNSTLCNIASLYSCQSNININDIPIKKYCCKRCTDLGTTTITTFSTQSSSTTLSPNCIDQSSSVCSIISAYTCTTNTLISGTPITTYCCKTCSSLNSDSQVSASTQTMTIPDNCQDVNTNICNIITPYTCTTNLMINQTPIGIYCCRTCFLLPNRPQTTTLSSCIDFNSNICSVISPYTCTTYTYISNINIKSYCCKTCNSYTNNQILASSAQSFSNVSSTIDGVCRDYEPDVCKIISKYTCNTFTFITNIPIRIYCCSTCNKLNKFLKTSIFNTPLNKSTGIPRQMIPTTSYGCIDMNSNICNYYRYRGGCDDSIFFSQMPIKTYCCRTCNELSTIAAAVSTQSIKLTQYTVPTATSSSFLSCVDSQKNCILWEKFCYILANLEEHPCKKTCKIC